MNKTTNNTNIDLLKKMVDETKQIWYSEKTRHDWHNPRGDFHFVRYNERVPRENRWVRFVGSPIEVWVNLGTWEVEAWNPITKTEWKFGKMTDEIYAILHPVYVAKYIEAYATRVRDEDLAHRLEECVDGIDNDFVRLWTGKGRSYIKWEELTKFLAA